MKMCQLCGLEPDLNKTDNMHVREAELLIKDDVIQNIDYAVKGE